MSQVLHESGTPHPRGIGRRVRLRRPTLLTLLALLGGGGLQVAHAQGYPGGGGIPGGQIGGRPGAGGSISPSGEEAPTQSTEKPDAAAKKAFKAGVKSLDKARDLEQVAAKATNPDKKAATLDKLGDAYNRALDQFTEALSNKGDMVEAWNYAGYVHLRLGAYRESIDDYNHTLALKPDLLEAQEGRGEAYVGVDRLDEAKATYMNLVNHSAPLAEELLATMRKWLESHRVAANGVRAADIDAFDHWLQEHGGASAPAGAVAAAPAGAVTPVPTGVATPVPISR